jgi:hypothetical protein
MDRPPSRTSSFMAPATSAGTGTSSSPTCALPNTGALVQVDGKGTFTVLAEGLDRPTSLEIINNTAYVVTLGGEIWTIDNIAGPPFGRTASSNPTAKGNR